MLFILVYFFSVFHAKFISLKWSLMKSWGHSRKISHKGICAAVNYNEG